MKIDFTKAQVLDLDGLPIIVDEKEIFADHKYLANSLLMASTENTGMQYLDRLELSMKINKGEVIDLEEQESEKLKTFISNMPNSNGLHVKAFLSCFKEKKPKENEG